MLARSSHIRRLRSLLAATVAASSSLAVVGCREEEQIQVYKIPHEQPQSAAPSRTPSAEAVPGRLIGALLPRAEETWFFKVLGPDAAVKPRVEEIRTFVKQVKFEGGRPKFAPPAAWREKGGMPNRFTTFVVDASTTPPVELAISTLPAGQDLAQNVNRWRKQLQLPEVSEAEAVRAAEALETAAGPAQWVELAGTYSADAAMPPFARGAGGMPADHPPIPAPAAPQPTASNPVVSRTAPVGSPVKYEGPADWTPTPPTEFNLAAFERTDDGGKVRITISEAQGDLLSNVNRWRGQLGLPAVDAAALESAVTKMKIGDRDGTFVELLGPAGERQTAIYAAVVPGANGSWFVKLMGDASTAARQRENFGKFLASLRFER